MSEKITEYDPEVAQWWQTSIIEMRPGVINFRGHPIQDLIGRVSFAQMIWLMIKGDMPSVAQAQLFESALVSAVDHGPQAPSIAASRMAATCGVGLNNVMATAINMLGDVHGGAGEQCIELYLDIKQRLVHSSADLSTAVESALAYWVDTRSKFIPGFGHRFHKPEDPRAPRLLQLVQQAAENNLVSGEFAAMALEIQAQLKKQKQGRAVPMNIDGATAVIFAELGFEPQLARGIFCLSRAVGILAHGWEQMQQGGRNKGPMPRKYLPKYIDAGKG